MIFNKIKEGLFRYQEADRGFVARIRTPADLLKAAEKVSQAGIRDFDCYTPFPIHGLENAMGLSRSWVPFITLIMGIFGASFALSFMTYVMAIDWPQIFGGKPFFSWPAFIPITFELTVLFAGHSTAIGVIVLGRLGKISRKPPISGVTSDSFGIWIADKSETEIRNILGDLAVEIKPVAQAG